MRINVYNIFILVIAFSALILLPACADEETDDRLQELENLEDPEEVQEFLSSVCEDEGGEWREFSDSCVDGCVPARNDDIMCSQVITEGCDCGSGMCWDGESCVEI